jgi:paraquat-inducible protein B
MPFKSEKQRRWMWANEPEMAKKWSDEEKQAKRKEGKTLKITKSKLRQIIQEELGSLNEQPANPAAVFYSAKMGMLNQLMDNLDEAHTALDSVAELAKSLSAHEQSAAAKDEEFMKDILKLASDAANLRDNKIDPTMRDLDGVLDAVQAMVSMGSGPEDE